MESLNVYIVFMKGAVLPSFLLILALWAMFSAVYLLIHESGGLSSRRKRGTVQKKYEPLRIEFFLLSVSVILGLTLLGREVQPESLRFNLVPFWTYLAIWQNDDMALALQIVLNILFFMPFGFALPLCFDSCRDVRRVLSVSAVFSGIIELIQGVFAIGLCEFDDVFHNALGALAGYAVFSFCSRHCALAAGKREEKEDE